MCNNNYYCLIRNIRHKNTQKLLTIQLRYSSNNKIYQNNIWENLEATKVRTRHIYIRPKVYKKYIPGSPVISSINFYKTKNFKFIDHYHQPHSTSIQSYFQDTTDFTNKLEIVKDKSKDSILVSLDVWAIYTFLTTRA